MRLALLLAAASGLAAGCGGGGTKQPDFADLHPVAGTLTVGGKAASGGVVRFHLDGPDADAFTTNSEVGTDGAFKLTTVRTTDSSGERKPGAPAGKYRVEYTPPLGDQTAGGATGAVRLPTPVTIAGPEATLKLDIPARKK